MFIVRTILLCSCFLATFLSIQAQTIVRDEYQKSVQEYNYFQKYNRELIAKIDKAWKPKTQFKSLYSIVEFDINEDGSISNLSLEKKSSSKDFDELCLKTILGLGKFKKPPNPHKWINVNHHFVYQPAFEENGKVKLLEPSYKLSDLDYDLSKIENQVPRITRDRSRVFVSSNYSPIDPGIRIHTAKDPYFYQSQKKTSKQRSQYSNLVYQKPGRVDLTNDDLKEIAKFKIQMPLKCKLGKECFLLSYPDHGDKKDYACGSRTDSIVNNTNFILKNRLLIKDYGDVHSVADGVVESIDSGFGRLEAKSVEPNSNDSCGNSILIRHSKDWVTKYCHLEDDSYKVSKGQKVELGEALAKVGNSGVTDYEKLGFSLLYKGITIDPFTGTSIKTKCNKESKTYKKSMWVDHIPYGDTQLIDSGFSINKLKPIQYFDGVSRQKVISADRKQLILTFMFLNGHKGDNINFKIFNPRAKLFDDMQISLTKNYNILDPEIVLNASGEKFEKGKWKVIITIDRKGSVVFSKTEEYNFI